MVDIILHRESASSALLFAVSDSKQPLGALMDLIMNNKLLVRLFASDLSCDVATMNLL